MFGSLLILLILPLTDFSRIRGSSFRPFMKFAFWLFVIDFLILMWIGSQHPITPYVEIGQIATAFYFIWFIVIVPFIGILENTLMDLALDSNKSINPSQGGNRNESITEGKCNHFLLNNPLSQIYLKLYFNKVRLYTTNSKGEIDYKLSDLDLYEWLRGFVDGEGCFILSPIKARPFTLKFVFKIKLHRDDRPLLEYLKTRIKIGKVYPKDILDKNISSTWEVFRKNDLLKLIKIFDKHPLNTSKYLDYILWRKAFLMYLESKEASVANKAIIKENILALKAQMNNKIESNILPSDHKINISPYWLLGFIEGEAWFHVKTKTFTLIFGIGQTINQKPVIEAIVKFLNNLIPENLSELKFNSNIINVHEKGKYKNSKPFIYLHLSRLDYILKIFIPFLDSLTFLSRKGLDYQDWKSVALIRKEGNHLTPEGKVFITNIRNRMNNNRLSTKGEILEEENYIN